MITIEEAQLLRPGQQIYELGVYNHDGTPRRWYVNGKVQLWKRTPNRFRVPLKHGLYAYGELTQYNADKFSITPPPSISPAARRVIQAGGRVSGVTIAKEQDAGRDITDQWHQSRMGQTGQMRAKHKKKSGKTIIDRALEVAGVKYPQNR